MRRFQMMRICLTMALYLAVQLFLALLQINAAFSQKNEIDMMNDDSYAVMELNDKLQQGTLGTTGTWEIACEKETLSLTCKAGEVINIMEAGYGRNDRTTCASYPHFNSTQCMLHSDALFRVKQRCHNKRRCSIRSSNDEFGDPCPGIIKYLKVMYACKPVQKTFRGTVTLCESESQQIKCPKGTLLMITDALYGRKDNITCCCRLMDINCMAVNALDLLSARCDYKESCNLESSNNVFGDPCSGTIKYLQVHYLCLPDKVQHLRYCEGYDTKLECKGNSFIDVIGAHYGRAHPFICLNGLQPFLKQGCAIKDVTNTVKERCQGKSWCTFPAKNEIFGDPCYGYTKHLDVDYSCTELSKH